MRFAKHLSLLLLVAFLVTSGFGCKGTTREEEEAIKPITLNRWGVYDESDYIEPFIAAYRAKHSNITINYKLEQKKA